MWCGWAAFFDAWCCGERSAFFKVEEKMKKPSGNICVGEHGDANLMESHFLWTLPSVLTDSLNNPHSNNPSKRRKKFIVAASDSHYFETFTFLKIFSARDKWKFISILFHDVFIIIAYITYCGSLSLKRAGCFEW